MGGLPQGKFQPYPRNLRLLMRGQFKHGYSRRGRKVHRLYSTWAGMIQRCHYPKSNSYKWYGGKGVKVCDAWHEFSNFLRDMLPGWEPHLTLERKDNSRGYEPGNCKWATTHEQRMNDGHGVLICFGGKTQRLTAWAQQLGISDVALRNRLNRGWSIERALTSPPKPGWFGTHK